MPKGPKVEYLMPEAYRNQNYSKLKKDCLKKGQLFEDVEFPATNKSLFFSKVDNDVEWKRPKELCKVPKLVVEGISCDDLNPGELGNHFFVTACSALAQEPKLFAKVVPDVKDQEWSDKNQYAGIFHFMFWRFGGWVDIVVDDRLPTKDGKLIFCQSKSRNEFWSALLEKAYAKLYGDYESLRTCHIADVMVDFTGGVSEKLVLSTLNLTSNEQNYKDLFTKLDEASSNGALITCVINCPESELGEETAEGLFKGEGYNVTDVKMVEVKKSLQSMINNARTLPMVRMFNPWGKTLWSGPWGETSPEYKSIKTSEWEKMGIKFQQEGEFWMHFDDFIKQFTNVDICHFVNTSFFSLKKTWSEAVMHSEWNDSGRNGGSDFSSTKFLSNPQFLFDVTAPMDRIMVSLEQHDIRHRQAIGKDMKEIGFQIMKVEENRKYRVHIHGEKMYCSEYLKARSVFGTTTLVKGRYVIVPTMKEQGGVAYHMLRLYTTKDNGGRELTEDCPHPACPCMPKQQLVTTLTVESAASLELPPGAKGGLDPFVVIKCEGETVKSDPKMSTKDPVFNIKATFYRKDPSKNRITIEVWNHNTLIDDFIAMATITGMDEEGVDEQGKELELKLFGRKKEAEVEKPGTLKVHMRSSDDLTYL